MLRRYHRTLTPTPRAAVALAALVALAACATLRQRDNAPPHPITITVENNLALPSDLTVYSVSLAGGAQILGTARPAGNTSFQMTPRSFAEPYRLLARTPSGQRIWSDQYTVNGPETGEVVWTLVPNILAFRDVPDSTATSDTTHR